MSGNSLRATRLVREPYTHPRVLSACLRGATLVFCFVTAALGMGSNPVPAAADELATARAAMAQFCSGIDSISGRYTTSLKESFIAKRPGSVRTEDPRSEVSFVYEPKTARLSMDETRSWIYGAVSKTERFTFRTIRTFDVYQSQTLVHTATSSPVKSEAPAERPLNLHHASGNHIDMEKGPWQWAGLRLHTLGVSLDEMLDLESATYAGTEETDGVACHRFDIVKDFWLLSVWLDPNRGWMPRRQELRKLDRDVAAAKRVKPWLMLRTEEFRQFRDPTSGAVIWFPSRGEATTSIEISAFELRDLTLNPPISPEQFRIDPSTLPDGVRVLDDGGRPTWYTGNRKDIYQEIEALIDAKDAEMKKLFDAAANPALAATARPGGDNSSGGFAWYWALGVVAVVLIVIGARKMLRKK